MALYAFDGTWNVRDQKDAIGETQPSQWGPSRAHRRDTLETNVHRFMEFYGTDDAEYLKGVGTRFSWLGRTLGGAFGAGGRSRIRKMYRRLTERYFAGDETIDIIGFSRGAALAVHFTNVLATHGLRHPDNPRHLAWWHYPELGWTFRHPKAGPNDVAGSKSDAAASGPKIDFLGLWDTVATFGWPIWPFRNLSKKWKVWTIPKSVRFSFHAMALDEVRATFELVRPKHSETKKVRHYEVWFRGVHSNVGGGYPDRGLADIALAWMMEMAIWQWGRLKRASPGRFAEALRLTEPEPPDPPDWEGENLETIEPDPNGEVGRPRSADQQGWRLLPESPLIHHSVFLRQEARAPDHLASNRSLLRRIPRNAQPVYDPPLFLTTAREAARRQAEVTLSRVPVRPSDWMRLDESYLFRSDNWIALGSALGRRDPEGRCESAKRKDFLRVATDWILAGKPEDPKGVPTVSPEERWILTVLLHLESYFVGADRTSRGIAPPD